MLFAKLVTNLKVFKPYLFEIILSILGPYSRSVYLLIEFFFKILLEKRNVSSEYYRHYTIKNVFKMAAFW